MRAWRMVGLLTVLWAAVAAMGCDGRIADLERQLTERRSDAESALRALTPGGSEFQTVSECLEFIRADRQRLRDVAVRFKRRADAAEERLRRVREIHYDDGTGKCVRCADLVTEDVWRMAPWPCETFRAATEEPVTPPPHSSEGGRE